MLDSERIAFGLPPRQKVALRPAIAVRLQAAIGWTALAATLLAALGFGGNRPVWWLALAAVILLLFAIQLVIDLRSPWSDEQVRWLLAPALAWLAVLGWALVQLMPGAAQWSHPAWENVEATAGLGTIAADPAAGWLLVPRLAAYGCLAWIAIRAGDDPRRAARMVQAVAIFASLLALYGLWAAASGTNPLLGPGAAPGGRVSATFFGQNAFATYAGLGALCNMACLLGTESEQERAGPRALRAALERFFGGRWFFAIGLVVCTVALAATQSRGGAVAGLAGFVGFLLAYHRSGRVDGWVAGAVAAAVLLFAVFVAGSGLGTRLGGTSEAEVRFAAYPLVVEAIASRPWLGHGLGGFQDVFRAYVSPDLAFAEWDFAHNSYLENVLELGVPAAVLLYLGLLLFVLRIWRGAVRRRHDRVFPALALGCATIAAVHALFDFTLQMPAIAALLAILLGIGWAQSFPRGSR